MCIGASNLQNAHAVVNVQLGDLPLISNPDVKLAMYFNSIVGVFCRVQWKQTNYFRASLEFCRTSLEGITLCSRDCSGTRKFLQSLKTHTLNFEVIAKLYFSLL